jgi:hypothetical protein
VSHSGGESGPLLPLLRCIILRYVREALWGLVASGGLYIAGSLLWVQLARWAWAESDDLPPELRRGRDHARDWKLRSLFRAPEPRSLVWLGGAVVIFALLWAADFGLLFQVLFVAGLSVWWTFIWIDAERSENREIRERVGVEPLPVNRFRRGLYVGGFYVFGFMIGAGTVGAACFVGGVIAATVT